MNLTKKSVGNLTQHYRRKEIVSVWGRTNKKEIRSILQHELHHLFVVIEEGA